MVTVTHIVIKRPDAGRVSSMTRALSDDVQREAQAATGARGRSGVGTE
jgi:hypothetical protein